MKRTIKFYQKQLKIKQIEIQILRQIGETINYNTDLKDILRAIIKIVSAYLESDSCFIYLIEDGSLVLEASQNPHPAALGKIKMKKGEGITGWVAKHKQTVAITASAYNDDRFKLFNSLPEDRFEAFLSVPLVWKDRVIGVINVQHRKKTEYQSEQRTFLEIIARQVGGAIENARLLSETNVLREALATRKLVDQAKAILIKNYEISEREAHAMLLKKSMDKRKSLKEIAEAVILSEEIAPLGH